MAGYVSMTHGEVNKLTRGIRRKDEALEKANEMSRVGKGVALAVSYATAFGMGYLRGTKEDPNTGAWNIPNSTIDYEAAAMIVLAAGAFGASYSDKFKKYSNFAALGALGVGCHYLGQIGRKLGRTGKWSTVAGVPGIGRDHVGALPQYDPTSYNPTQFSAPYGDPVASSLSSAGV